MDDANVPSLLSLPYLGAVSLSDPIYQNTRRYVLSKQNPFYFKGNAAEGIGGPHVGLDMVWPISIIMKDLTSTDDKEIKYCLKMLQESNASTGFMHESFHKDDLQNLRVNGLHGLIQYLVNSFGKFTKKNRIYCHK